MGNKNSLSARNMGAMISLMTLCSLLITGFSEIGQDMWLAVIAATILAAPMILIYARIGNIHRGMGLYDMVYKQFGTVIGGIFTALIAWFALHVSALVSRNFCEFISISALETTPKIFVIIGMIAVGGYLASKDFQVMGKWSIIVMAFIFGNFALTFLLLLPSMHISNIKPIMEHGFSTIFSTGFSFASIAFIETFCALVACGSLKEKESPYKAYLLGIGWGAMLLVYVVLRNVLVLGRDMLETSFFPSYIATRIISPGAFIEHIESIVSLNMVLMGITKASLCLRAAAMGVAKLMRNEDAVKSYLVPICLLSICISITTFSNIRELIIFVQAYRYYSALFAILIPLIIWIKSEFWYQKQCKAKG